MARIEKKDNDEGEMGRQMAGTGWGGARDRVTGAWPGHRSTSILFFQLTTFAIAFNCKCVEK